MKLRKLKEKDVFGMLEWMHYDESKYIFEKDFSKYGKEDVLSFINSNNSNEVHYACVDDNDNYLGTVSLKNIDRKNCNAELAISFVKKGQGTGAALFALNEIISIGFNKLGLYKIYLNVLSTNVRAKKFYIKNRFKKEGCFRNHIKKDDNFIDLEWYGIYRDYYKL